MSEIMQDRKFRFLGLGLIGIGALVVVSLLLFMWTDTIGGSLLWDILLTAAVLGGYLGFLVMVKFDAPGTRYPIGLKILAVFATLLTLTLLAEIWTDAFTVTTFSKMVFSQLLVIGLIALIIVIKEDVLQAKRMRDENYLD
ncbi:MAG: hypothetical protein GC136_09450 [Alphaproteobacteria bacterium]|nr:hypothetical protein [Alphaproteobacteria bacterium]